MRQMRKLFIIMALLLVAAAPPKLTLEEAVKKCVEVVRASSDAQFYKGFSKFDAYVTRSGRVKYLGSPAELFQFEKCLDQHGHPLSE